MNIRKHFATALALATVTLGFTAIQANAQPVLKGTFELPAAVYWGNTLLQPGQYTIWMSTEVRDVARVPVIHVSGEGVSVQFLAIAKPERESARNTLEISEIAGTHVVRAFDAGLIGESFAFGVTKTVKGKALRASTEPVMTIPVTSASAF
jgi:hypothetical protein